MGKGKKSTKDKPSRKNYIGRNQRVKNKRRRAKTAVNRLEKKMAKFGERGWPIEGMQRELKRQKGLTG